MVVAPSETGLSGVAANGAAAGPASTAMSRSPSATALGHPAAPITCPPLDSIDPSTSSKLTSSPDTAVLELADGTAYTGYSFGAEGKSVSGECVFQTGMVGYVESLTDPSYEGQILVITYPLVGNYGVPSRDDAAQSLPNLLTSYFESSRIHVAALVISYYSEDFSHYLAQSSLGDWLKENGVPAIYGVDTRALTKRIREKGSMLGKVLVKREGADASHLPGLDAVSGAWRSQYVDIPWQDPNVENLVAKVSLKEPKAFKPTTATADPANPPQHKLHPSGRPLRVLAIDVGMKYNQIRCFTERGVELKVVPWNYDFLSEAEAYDGLFVSNGPGDPTTVNETILRLRQLIERGDMPIFGICLGHQLLALAAGAKTRKLKYGNRGHNIPCTDQLSDRCYITSQNHGYEVDSNTLPAGWEVLFVNANDGTNEGIRCVDKPFFSVQFHPESTPGPRDTEWLFDVFIKNVQDCAALKASKPAAKGNELPVAQFPGGLAAENAAAYPRLRPQKVLVLGSGGLSIGQAGEFDYSGSQAIKALKEEGIYTVLINPNIATIQTSSGLADKVYFLPVTPEFVLKVIQHEQPDGIYCTFGGQTALNVGIKLKDEFDRLGVKVLGTPIDTIITTEDREFFANAMAEIGEHCAPSAAANNMDEALAAAKSIGYPVIVRAAYALGGLGSGFAKDEQELTALCNRAFASSPQVLVEKSMKGWKEIEYEVVRDGRNNCITVCNMENFDPLGIHTGDSIVVAPSQTLSDEDYNMLRTTAVNVIRHLGVVGECNIQYALNPFSKEYCIIEVNARLSRSSALASKATGYPLAFIAAKLGLGIPLNEIRNTVTKETSACFEPSLDYVVVKMPRWDLKKFIRVSTSLGSSMKSVGEVMSIGRTFEETIQKAIRSIDPSFDGFGANSYAEPHEVDHELSHPSDKRIFAIANALVSGYTVEDIWKKSHIDKWFLRKLERITRMEKIVSNFNATTLPREILRQAKQLGFSDKQIAKSLGSTELAVRRLRQEGNVMPFVKQIDTVAAEFPAHTNYLYTTFNAVEHDVSFDDMGIMVLGSGVYRIGSSVEFDWCAVRAIRTLRENGFKTVMVNYNPETVSTDYDESDRLYFENISLETVLDIYDTERSKGVILSMGGQTPNNIALALHRQNVKILGTSPEMIDTAENRYKFSRMLDKIGVDQPLWKELTSFEEAHEFCKRFGYPVLVRPSYVLSGAAMNVVYSPDDLSNYLSQATAVSREHPVVISKYIEEAKEIEMDAVARDGKLVMHFISEHIENAGVHSGDATLILPPQDLDPETVRRIEAATQKIGAALHVTGPYNIQFIAKNNEIKVIECNLRAARSFPFVSKVTGIDAIEMATKAMLGLPIEPYPQNTMPEEYVGVKVPQFSFSRLLGADPVLGVEMASTGEVAAFGKNKYEAYLKALLASAIKIPRSGSVLLSVGSFKEKLEILPSVRKLQALGFTLYASAGTADFLSESGVNVRYLEALDEEHIAPNGSMAAATGPDLSKKEYDIFRMLASGEIKLYINLPSRNKYRRPASFVSKGYRTRRLAIDRGIPLVTNIKNVKILVEAMSRYPGLEADLSLSPVDSKTSHRTYTFPGLINFQAFLPSIADPAAGARDLAELTKASLAGGFTQVQVAPSGLTASIEDARTLEIAEETVAGAAHCDLSFAVTATAENAARLSEVSDRVRSLYIPFNAFTNANINKVAAVAAHFGAWPEDKPIITDAKTTDLASILLLASLHSRSIHVTNVTSRDDIQLIALSKEKSLKVTCDVSVYSLFFTSEMYPASTCLPTAADQKALWDSLAVIDAFSVGSTPYQLAQELGFVASPWSGMEECLLLLLNAVNEGRLTLEDITLRLHDKPREIFDLPEQPQTSIEVEVDRRASVRSRAQWSPLAKRSIMGSLHRVVVHGQTVVLDGKSLSDGTLGTYVSASTTSGARTAKRRESKHRFSISSSSGRPPVALSASPMPSTQVLSPILGAADGPASSASRLSAMALNQPFPVVPPPLPTPGMLTLDKMLSNPSFSRRHILSVKQFTKDDLHALFAVAQEMRTLVEQQGVTNILRGKVLTTLFYEESTRTSSSFEAAMVRCGGQVVTVNTTRSSIAKGETLGDTVRTLGCYGDAIVLRHPAVGAAQLAAKTSPVPIINAGDGVGEHPTQALLDVFTMREELGTVNGLTITLLGDLKNGRTAHSLVKLLSLYHVTLNYVSPPSLAMPEDVKAEASRRGILQYEVTNLDTVIGQTDVLYVTRVQRERMDTEEEYEKVKDAYRVNNDVLIRAKEHMIVMHPLPRVNEIDPEVDFDQRRAAYFRQMRYGLFVRMALLSLVLGRY